MRVPAAPAGGYGPDAGPALSVAPAVAGLYLVTWCLSVQTAHSAAGQPPLGSAFLAGYAARVADPAFAATIGYGVAKFTGIWKALAPRLLLDGERYSRPVWRGVPSPPGVM